MSKTDLAMTLTQPPTQDGEDLREVSQCVGLVEVRADLVGDVDPDWIRARTAGEVLYSLRTADSGGRFRGSAVERRARLERAAVHYDIVELEPSDLTPGLLETIRPNRRLISWRGGLEGQAALAQRFASIAAVDARLYRMVVLSEREGSELGLMSFLARQSEPKLVAYASGQRGLWTRILAPRLGAPLVFGADVENNAGNFVPSVRRLIEDYGCPAAPSVDKLFGVVGNPVLQSLSPRLHNAAYRALGMPCLFLPFFAEDFREFWKTFAERTVHEHFAPLDGLTVLSPFKKSAGAVTKHKEDIVRQSESSNMLVKEDDSWIAKSTDPESVIRPLSGCGVLASAKRVAVVGSGGSGRAIAASLKQQGSEVTLFNRNEDRGRAAAKRLGVRFLSLSAFSAEGFSLIVNATPFGAAGSRLPFPIRDLEEDAIVIDLGYGSGTSELVAQARHAGRIAIDGRQVLLTQVSRQFEVMTGVRFPSKHLSQILPPPSETVAEPALSGVSPD